MPTETKCTARMGEQDMALSDGGAGITCENVRQKATGALSVEFFPAGFNGSNPVSRTLFPPLGVGRIRCVMGTNSTHTEVKTANFYLFRPILKQWMKHP